MNLEVEEGDDEAAGRWKLTVGNIELNSGYMSAAVPVASPYDYEGKMVYHQCYQNCVDFSDKCPDEESSTPYDTIVYVGSEGLVTK